MCRSVLHEKRNRRADVPVRASLHGGGAAMAWPVAAISVDIHGGGQCPPTEFVIHREPLDLLGQQQGDFRR
jgi:hypothetical protein